ncbi:MAG: phosphate ABC transporter permease subunit PstC [Ktedonobacterales bacterium]
MEVPLSTTSTSLLQRRLAQLRVMARRPGDLLFRALLGLFVVVVVAIVLGVAWLLISGAWLSIRTFGFKFITNNAFDPIHNSFGVGPAIFGTVVTSVFAMIFAVPLGIGTAIFLIDFCPRWLSPPLAFLVDTLAAIPSIVIGLWGAVVLVPWLQTTGEPWLQKHFGFLPLFQGPISGFGLLAAGLILTIMVLPIITAITREVMRVVPVSQREGMLALGATRWEVIRYAVLPFARAGIIGGAILGLGRALGETIAVTLVIGNQASPISPHLFSTGYTLSSVIANQFGEAGPGLFISAIMETGLILLTITLVVNVIARVLISRLGRERIGGLTV